MSDLKQTCPACNSHTSAIGIAFRDGEPCPYCGLPAEAAAVFEAAVERGANEGLAERMAQAEARAARAEEKAARLQSKLNEVRRLVTGE